MKNLDVEMGGKSTFQWDAIESFSIIHDVIVK